MEEDTDLLQIKTRDKGVVVSELEYIFKYLWLFSKSRLYFDENIIFMMSGSKYVHELNRHTRHFLIINHLDENPKIRFLNDHFSVSTIPYNVRE